MFTVLNCARLLTRVLPYIFEDPEWRGFFWTSLPDNSGERNEESSPLAHSLLNAISVSYVFLTLKWHIFVLEHIIDLLLDYFKVGSVRTFSCTSDNC